MKTTINSAIASAVLLLCATITLNAQSYQGEFQFQTDRPIYVFCLDEQVTGYYTYHVTYHVDKKTGFINRVHWNVKESKFVGVDTGKEYRLIDTGGTDSWGYLWGFFAAVGVYSPDLLPPSYPIEGTVINSTFKWMSNGIAYKGSIVFQLHRDASGEIKAFVLKYDLCF